MSGTRRSSSGSRRRVLAVASGGGHWVQLLRLRPAFEHCDVEYASVSPDYAAEVPGRRFHLLPDATRWERRALLLLAFRALWLVLCRRPDVIVTTGAAPGLLALIAGRLVRARTVWVDSIANVEEMSLSGRQARRFADLWLTQWEHLAGAEGPGYEGAVL